MNAFLPFTLYIKKEGLSRFDFTGFQNFQMKFFYEIFYREKQIFVLTTL